MKKQFFLICSLLLLFWYFNFCSPLDFDDYVYSYVWTAGNMERPLAETAQRVNSFKDIFQSQWNHYFTWGGRSIAHTLLQFFLWQGKSIFNVINAFCFVFLLLEMQWIIDRGNVGFCFKAKDMIWTFAVLWIFSIMMGDIFVWMTLSCNYLWTTVLVLAFLLVYERDFFSRPDCFFNKHEYMMFFLGLVSGWTNENVPCFIIIVLGYYIYKSPKIGNKKAWLYAGLKGFVIGYLILILAPGNYVRYNTMLGNGIVLSGIPLLKANVSMLLKVVFLRIVLLFYVLNNLINLRNLSFDKDNHKAFILSVVFAFLGIGSLSIMLFSPEFRFRSSFPGLVFLVVSAGLIRSIKTSIQAHFENRQDNYFVKWTKIFCSFYVCITLATSLYMYTLQRCHTNIMLSQIYSEKENPTGKTLVVRERPYALKDAIFYNAITGFHLVFPYSILADEHWWINRDISKYYGITAIRTEKGEAFQ